MIPPLPSQEREAIFRSCRQVVFSHGRPRTPAEELLLLAALPEASLRRDFYGQGELIGRLEARVAALLGKESAVFMPSGTMAQVIAMRIWSERAGVAAFGMHPLCHLEQHEFHAYRALHGLDAALIGARDRVLGRSDLEALGDKRLAALVYELPQRDLGGALPGWDELAAVSAWARERGVAFHLDGARLWEAQPFYGRSHAEICSHFDSVYVSFYKGLGAIAGAALAGPARLVEEARIWQRRQGGNLISLYPYVLSAGLGLERYLPRFSIYRDRAAGIAQALKRLPGVQVTPDPPQCSFMYVTLPAPAERVMDASHSLAREKSILLVSRLREGADVKESVFELVVGEATLDFTDERIAELFAELLGRAR